MSEIVRKSLDPDQAAELTRLLLEKSFQDTVMSFQRLAEQLYGEIPNAPATRHNVFQNVDGGSELWAKALNHGYDDVLSSDEMRRLRIYFQQRHLLAHRHGIVDDDYVARSGDTAYVVGQRLVLGESDVLDFANIVERLGTALIELSSGGKITTQK